MPPQDNPKMNETGEFFADFLDYATESMKKSGLSETEAGNVAVEIMVKLSQAFAGQPFYVTNKPQIFARQMQMYNDLKHMNHKEVDKKYGVSRGYSLKVAKQIRDARKRREALK